MMQRMILQGTIMKGIGGFYYVEAADTVYECKAKGRFRREKLTPLAGDRVSISVTENSENTIEEILPRRNFLARPPVANLDQLAIVCSVCHPTPSTLVIDRLTAMAEKREIEPIIILSKTDLGDADALAETYRLAGFRTFCVSNGGDWDTGAMLSLFSGKLTALCGNSGVGKSTLLNMLCPGFQLQTGEISEKLGRGRHTTRQTELFHLAGGLVADTAGFSALDFLSGESLLADELAMLFREFEPCIGKCKFTSCSHVADAGCAVIEAVKSGKIPVSRHESYVAIYNEIKDIKKWQL